MSVSSEGLMTKRRSLDEKDRFEKYGTFMR